jgi:hypothetical protein
MVQNSKCVTYCTTSRDGEGRWHSVFGLIIVFTKQKRARNRANFHCCRLEQHEVFEAWLQIVSADKFGTLMITRGWEMLY